MGEASSHESLSALQQSRRGHSRPCAQPSTRSVFRPSDDPLSPVEHQVKNANSFVVTLSAGRYDDHCTNVHRVYADKDAATRYVSHQNAVVENVRTMERAFELLMEDWEKHNPTPYVGSSREGDAYDQWHERRCVEQARIETILELKKLYEDNGLHFNDRDAETMHYSLAEVPNF